MPRPRKPRAFRLSRPHRRAAASGLQIDRGAEAKEHKDAKDVTARDLMGKEAAARAAAEKLPIKTASAAAAAATLPPVAGQKCRVWTASYGGQKALIIRSIVDRVVNYTVLDVNDGAEKREAEAFERGEYLENTRRSQRSA